MNTSDVILTGALVRAAYAGAAILLVLIALAAVFLLHLWLDSRRVGTTGKSAYELIDDTPLSLAVYRGLVFLAFCIAFAGICSMVGHLLS